MKSPWPRVGRWKRLAMGRRRRSPNRGGSMKVALKYVRNEAGRGTRRRRERRTGTMKPVVKIMSLCFVSLVRGQKGAAYP